MSGELALAALSAACALLACAGAFLKVLLQSGRMMEKLDTLVAGQRNHEERLRRIELAASCLRGEHGS
jgi:hypothetical protein